LVRQEENRGELNVMERSANPAFAVQEKSPRRVTLLMFRDNEYGDEAEAGRVAQSFVRGVGVAN